MIKIIITAMILMLSGCAEIEQQTNRLSKVLKDLGDKIKHADTEAEAKNLPEKKELSINNNVSTPRGAPSKQESVNISIPKDTLVVKPQEQAVKSKPAEIRTVITPKSAVSKEVKSAPVSEHISLNELNSHNWQISKIPITNNFKATEYHWLFNFNPNGRYKAFGACNYLSGKFRAYEDGSFRLGKLESSSNQCPESKNEEVMVFNLLLMADSFAIREQALVLKNNGKVMMELKTTNQEIEPKVSYQSHNHKETKSRKSKASRKKSLKTQSKKSA